MCLWVCGMWKCLFLLVLILKISDCKKNRVVGLFRRENYYCFRILNKSGYFLIRGNKDFGKSCRKFNLELRERLVKFYGRLRRLECVFFGTFFGSFKKGSVVI